MAHFHICPICGGTWGCTDSECYADGSEFACPACYSNDDNNVPVRPSKEE